MPPGHGSILGRVKHPSFLSCGGRASEAMSFLMEVLQPGNAKWEGGGGTLCKPRGNSWSTEATLVCSSGAFGKKADGVS